MIKNFFNISDLSEKSLRVIIGNEIKTPSLLGKNIGLIFEKYSTRTRLSFNVGINQLNGNPIDIRLDELNISRDESFEDTFKAMNCYLDALIFRTTDHDRLKKASLYFKKPIINALSNLSHPCQIISDLYTLNEHFNKLDLNILWIGDMNNVCFSLVEAVNLLPELNLTICTPKIIQSKMNWNFNNNISIVNNYNFDLSQIDCVMTDVFISMNDSQNEEKINLLKYLIVDEKLMQKTKPNSVFMHCLPAQVGFEVSKETFNSNKSIVWKQAFNRLIAQKNLFGIIEW